MEWICESICVKAESLMETLYIISSQMIDSRRRFKILNQSSLVS